MDKTFKTYLAVSLGFVLLFLLIVVFQREPANWTPTYSLDKKGPLDLYVFNHEFESLAGNNRIKRVTVTPYEYICENDSLSNYLIIYQSNMYSDDSVLLSQVYKGCNLFVFADKQYNSIPDSLYLKYYFDNPLNGNPLENSVNMSLTMKNWGNKTYFLNPVFSSMRLDEADLSCTTTLGTIQTQDSISSPNFIRVKYGKGYVYIHTHPEVLTNMALLSPDNSSSGYVAHVLSYISKDKPIVWFVKGQTNNINIPINETVLSVIFRYPSLQMAWLIFVYGIVLFLIFNAKRRQRTIPVIKPARNTTVEFVKTIANLYFQEGEIPGVVEKKIVYFLNRIRLKYYLDTSILNDSFVEKLHSKSGKDKELIRSIVSFINTFERNKTATQKELINFSKMVEKMWLGNDKHQHSNKR